MKLDDGDSTLTSKSIDLRLDRADNREAQIDTATAVAAKTFGDVPLRVPFWKASAIEAQVSLLESLPGSELTLRNVGSSTNQKTRQEEENKRSLDHILDAVEFAQERQERQRREWAETTHSFAGQNLTGREWGQMADELKSDSPGRRWLLDYLMQKGKTQAEAEKTVADMQLASSAMSKPESDRTADEKAALGRVKADPDASRTFEHYQKARAQGFPAGADATLVSASHTISVEEGADALSGAASTAPELSAHYRAALSASTPLDAKTDPRIAPQPAPLSPANAGMAV